MPTLMPTAAEGAMTKPMPMIYPSPTGTMTDDMIKQQVHLDGLNTVYVLDCLSAALTHERCGRHLYRSVEGRTNNPILKRKYDEFGGETEHHVEILEELVVNLGGNPNYVSPAARATENADTALLESTFLLGGSIDLMLAESVMLDAVMLAETKDHANWLFLNELVGHLDDGAPRDLLAQATGEVLGQEREHLEWATRTSQQLMTMQARSDFLATAGTKATELMTYVRSWLS